MSFFSLLCLFSWHWEETQARTLWDAWTLPFMFLIRSVLCHLGLRGDSFPTPTASLLMWSPRRVKKGNSFPLWGYPTHQRPSIFYCYVGNSLKAEEDWWSMRADGPHRHCEQGGSAWCHPCCPHTVRSSSHGPGPVGPRPWNQKPAESCGFGLNRSQVVKCSVWIHCDFT